VKHGERKSMRMNKHDYSSNAMYYITICVDSHRCLFGYIEHGSMILNEFGRIAKEEWDNLPQRFPGLELNAIIIMPNHIHCIITYTKNSFMYTVGAALAAAQSLAAAHDGTNIPVRKRAAARAAPTSVPDIIGAYKSLVYVRILQLIKSQTPEIKFGKLWQRSFCDRVVHDAESYMHYVNYINDNPKNWKNDPFFK